jgi:hypothetical protein
VLGEGTTPRTNLQYALLAGQLECSGYPTERVLIRQEVLAEATSDGHW